MQSQLIAVVLSIFASAASAQGTAASVADAPTPNRIAKVSHVTTAAPVAHSTRGELIKTAAAGTRDEPMAPREQGPSIRPTAALHAGTSEDHPRRSGTGMLLAALALMSGIALRRSGNNPQ